jgi:hypothetical protein
MRFLLALLAALSLAAAARAADYVVIVFDDSGSMDEYMRAARKSRLNVAKEALAATIAQVPPTTHVGLLTFHGWAYDLQPVDQQAFSRALSGVRANGGTPLYEHMKAGADRLLAERAKQGNVGSYKLLVVTDGQATDGGLNRAAKKGDYDFPGVTREIVNRGLVIDTIGLEMAGDHELKGQINGFYMRGDDPSSLKAGLTKSVAEVGFGGKDGLSNEAFKDIGEMPEAAARTAILGLTDFQNQPVGDPPPMKQVVNGVMAELQSRAAADSTWAAAWIVTFLVVIMAIVSLIVSSSNPNHRRR